MTRFVAICFAMFCFQLRESINAGFRRGVSSNHYHVVVQCEDGLSVRGMLVQLHSDSSEAVNTFDGAQGRRVWFQFRDTALTFERSWLARLKYTHENAVHHRLTASAVSYPWCSAGWFEANARKSFVDALRRVKIDRVHVYDDY